jgi:hypothetical protein
VVGRPLDGGEEAGGAAADYYGLGHGCRGCRSCRVASLLLQRLQPLRERQN